MLNEKIKFLRRSRGMTQEELAEKVCVSRQAITKWESGAGVPDISNIESLCRVFGVSYDSLLGETAAEAANVSRTEFDIFEKSGFEIDVGNANTLELVSGAPEKALVELRTDLPDAVHKLAKVRVQEGKRVDLAVVKIQLDKKYLRVESQRSMSRSDARKHLFVKVCVPADQGKIELRGSVENLCIHDIPGEAHIEFDGKASRAEIYNMGGRIELDSGADMEIGYDASAQQLDINQIGCVSRLCLAEGARADVYSKGRSCGVVFENCENAPDSERKVELNGYKSELTVVRA